MNGRWSALLRSLALVALAAGSVAADPIGTTSNGLRLVKKYPDASTTCAPTDLGCLYLNNDNHPHFRDNNNVDRDILAASTASALSTALFDNAYTHHIDVGNPFGSVWLHITPGDPSAYSPGFFGTYQSNAVNPDTGNDNVVSLGHNCGPGGGVWTNGKTANCWKWEDHYEPDPFGNPTFYQSETHLSIFDENGVENRVISVNGPKTGLARIFFDADQVTIGSGPNLNAPAAIAVSSFATNIYSPLGPTGGKSILMDTAGTQVIMSSANGAGSAGVNLDSGIPNVAPAIAGINSTGLIRLCAGGFCGLEIGNGGPSSYTHIFDPFDLSTFWQAGSSLLESWVGNDLKMTVGATGVGLKNFLNITHDNVNADTNGNVEAILLRNNTQGTGLQQQFSPTLVFTSYGWNGTFAQANSFSLQEQPDGAGNSSFVFAYSFDEANFTQVASFSSVGGLGLFGHAAPTAQYNTTGTTSGTSSGAGAALNVDGCATGGIGSTCYTLGDMVRWAKSFGGIAL